jgi:hypothetical protein
MVLAATRCLCLRTAEDCTQIAPLQHAPPADVGRVKLRCSRRRNAEHPRALSCGPHVLVTQDMAGVQRQKRNRWRKAAQSTQHAAGAACARAWERQRRALKSARALCGECKGDRALRRRAMPDVSGAMSADVGISTGTCSLGASVAASRKRCSPPAASMTCVTFAALLDRPSPARQARRTGNRKAASSFRDGTSRPRQRGGAAQSTKDAHAMPTQHPAQP